MNHLPFPNKKYQIIYADPPWQYRDKCNAGKRGASFKYETPDKQWLYNLPVRTIAAEDAVLFMWVTMPMLAEGLEVIKAWGFNYKTVGFVWVKKNKIKDSPFWGMGNWTRANAELCLFATRGKPERVSAGVHSVICSPIRKHSQKPDETRDMIITLVGDKSRIELFARERVESWDAWGDEIDGSCGPTSEELRVMF